MENKPNELFELIAMNPGLINERSQGNQDTLFMRACRYLHKDIIEILLNEQANPTDINNHGNNAIMCLFYREDQHKKPKNIFISHLSNVMRRYQRCMDIETRKYLMWKTEGSSKVNKVYGRMTSTPCSR